MRMINGYLLACTAALASLGNTLAAAIERFAAFVLALMPASKQLAVEGAFPRAENMLGTPIDGALQHDMRHEAGVSRRASARNT